MTPPARRPDQSLSLCPVVACVAACLLVPAGLTGCVGDRSEPLLVGTARSAAAVEPSNAPVPGWREVDAAVIDACIAHEVVATARAPDRLDRRSYDLLAPRDRPGLLTLTRTPSGLVAEVRVGRFGDPELERSLLDSIDRVCRLDRAADARDRGLTTQ